MTDSPIHRYHDGTKHHFNRYARSMGYLDWASQPRPFRSYSGALRLPLPPDPSAGPAAPDQTPITYHQLLASGPVAPSPLTLAFVGDLLRHSLGLSAWKIAGQSRWALRVNPSSGNLHPTEAYVIGPGLPQGAAPGVWHYAPDAHALERRCACADDWRGLVDGRDALLVVLTSIHWREAWKYGERAFRYCQHDLGHAIAAITIAARMLGWRATLQSGWSSARMASVAGLDRDADFVETEREEPGCVMALVPGNEPVPGSFATGEGIVELVARGQWSGHASQLSEDHVEWTFIDEIAEATRSSGWTPAAVPESRDDRSVPLQSVSSSPPDARALLIQRRSAVAFDGRSSIDAEPFFAMLSRVMPTPTVPWDGLWWTPSIHLLLFVHRVRGIDPGLYLLARTPEGGARLRAAFGRDFEQVPAHPTLPLTRLGLGDCRALARRLSCDQDIAADGFFSLGMIAEFDTRLAEYGEAFYRHLFWESGVVGQMLYLEAEAAAVRGTGIGCFFDDAVHDVLGLRGHAFQSLYHFTVGVPVEDRRLTTEPGYVWE